MVSGTTADVEFSNKHYVYKGLALGSTDGESLLYAANFSKARIDVFDDHFRRVKLPHAFKDAQIPDGFAPFDVQLLDGDLYVSYAKQDAAKHDDVAGPGNGFVDVYDTSGKLLDASNLPRGSQLPMGSGDRAGELRRLQRRPARR